MSTTSDDAAGAFVAFVSGAIVGVAATLLLVRMQNKRVVDRSPSDDDYRFDGGDIFV